MKKIFTNGFRVRFIATPRRLAHMKILVVEDDRKVAGFIEQGLKEEGYVVDVAPDGDEATMLAHVYDYDVILLDVVLPEEERLPGGHRAAAGGPQHARS